jgi:hypothetical protein
MTSISGAASWLAGAYGSINNTSSASDGWLASTLASRKTSYAPGTINNFLNTSSSVANIFAGVSQNLVSGLGDLAARTATARMQADTQKKLDALIKETTDLTFDSSPPTSITTAGDGTLDLVANTFTLRDGTVLDITTGRKVDKTI